MAAASSLPRSLAASGLDRPLPEVRVELRHGSARPLLYPVSDLCFLIGSVPGCDVRLPGADLPPIVAIIVRHAGGVGIRRLVATQPVQVNGQAHASAPLVDGDRVTIGAVELIIHVVPPPPTDGLLASETPVAHPPVSEPRHQELDERQRLLEEQTRELETDRVLWYGRREQIEQELRALQESQQAVATAQADLRQREDAATGERNELDQRAERLAADQQQLQAVRQELTATRQELYDRYRQRRDRLAGLQEAVNQAARKVQERKRQIDAEQREATERLRQDEAHRADLTDRAAELDQIEATRRAAIEARAEELARIQEAIAAERRRLEQREQELLQAHAGRFAELQARTRQLDEDRQALENQRTQYETDLIRLDRWSATLEQRQQESQHRADELEQRHERLRQDAQELEAQAVELNEWRTRLARDEENAGRRKEAGEAQEADLARRAVALETQQAMLAALRTRLERSREETRQAEEELTDQRAHLEETETDLRRREQESERLRAVWEAGQPARDEECQRLEEWRAQVEATAERVGQRDEQFAAEGERLRLHASTLDARAAEQVEAANVVQARALQIQELQERLTADRQALRERDADLAQAETARLALQEQLRRRSEGLGEQLRALGERDRQLAETAAALELRRTEIEQVYRQGEDRLSAVRQELDGRAGELDRLRGDLVGREEQLGRRTERLKEVGRRLGANRKALRAQQAQAVATHRQAAGAAARLRSEFEALRGEVDLWQQQFPDGEAHARAAAEHLARARDQLREYLAQLHGYAGQTQEDLTALRGHVLGEAEAVRQQALTLHRAREEHRLAIAGFRQQLVEWQGVVAEMKRALLQDESRLERRQAEVAATSVRLARQAEELQVQEREVSESRAEMEHHLAEMREWYRRKLRELTEHHRAHDGTPNAPSSVPMPGSAADAAGLDDEPEPGDHQLGALLRTLELVEADTLTALLAEARRRRQSLRQVLLNSGYLTLYQLALIEAGNLDGLVLGPVRVLDRLRVTPHESAYRVFDPRRATDGTAADGEAILRHLAEAEMQDAVRPDEFRQRFAAAAALRHPNLAATWEVLEIKGRPAVLQESVAGLPAPEWPPLVAVPGVWFRLVCQTALGLQTAHQAGLIHGHLQSAHLVLAPDGIVKLTGWGEPPWLSAAESRAHEQTVLTDLAALGRLAAGWVAPLTRRGGKSRPLPEPLQSIIQRLTPDAGAEGYVSAAALLEDLDRVSGDISANPSAWQRLVQFARDHVGGNRTLRQSA